MAKSFKKIIEIKFSNETVVVVRTDKNGQLCDIQPRLGTIHTDYQGRPWELIEEEVIGKIEN